jgi:hypothetical protein
VLVRDHTLTTEEYSGFSWSAGGNLSTARELLGGAGTQTAALGFGGEPPPAGLNRYRRIWWSNLDIRRKFKSS